MKNPLLLLGCLLVISACVSVVDNPFFKEQQAVATITDKRLVEVSGLEQSYTNPGHLWAHNDSGHDPSVYLIDHQGAVKMEVKLKGVENRDWEDMVTLEENGRSWIYIAEIGDNKAVHKTVSLIRLQEPSLIQGKEVTVRKEDLDIMRFQYAEGARDAEAVFYDYRKKEFVLVTKREDESMVYAFPFQTDNNPVTIKSKGTIPDRNFTSGDMNESGEILLKHYDAIYYWPASDLSASDQILKWNPIDITYRPEPQGEAMCWHLQNFFTLSEKNRGRKQEMFFFERK